MNPKTFPDSQETDVIPINQHWTNQLLHHLARGGKAFRMERAVLPSQTDQALVRITFPRISLQDSESEIHLALFIHSIPHGSHWLHLGAIRQLCGNRILFTTAVEEWIPEPEDGISLEELPGILNVLPAIRNAAQKRINWMQRLRIRDRHLRAVRERISEDLGKDLPEQLKIESLTQWQLHNLLTHHVGHEVPRSKQLPMLLEVSRLFKL